MFENIKGVRLGLDFEISFLICINRTYLNLLFQSPIEPVYNSMSPDVCIGDHKPVFLSFTLRIEEEVPQNGNVNDVLTELDDTYKECIKGINNAMNEEGTSLQE